jgi:hypothetical protein
MDFWAAEIPYLMLGVLLAGGVTELLLLGLRRITKGYDYLLYASVLRGLAYSPSALAGGHGVIVLPLCLGLIGSNMGRSGFECYAYSGIPFAVVAGISFCFGVYSRSKQSAQKNAEK